jgi:DoxX-like family
MTDHPGSAVLPKAAASSRRRTVTYWAVSLPFLAETALGIQWDLQRGEYVRGLLDKIRFPYYFHTALGVSKVLALAALLVPGFPRLKEWAYAGTTFVYVGAAASHIAVHDGAAEVVPPLILAVDALASWALRPPSRRDPAPLPDAWARLVARR